jgi:ATP-binding cassette subfamily B protein
MREINTVGDSFGAMAIFFANMLHFIFFLAVPFCISWQVTLISFSAAVVFAIPFLLMGRLSYRLGKLNTKTANYLMSVLYENLNLAKIVLGYGNQDKAWMGLAGAFNEHRKATLKSQTLDRVIAILYRPFGVLVVIVALIASRRLHVPLSEITVLLLALMEVGISVGNLTTQKNSLDSFFPSYEQITSLRKRARDMRQASGTKIFSSFSDRIRLDNVSFTYPGLEPVLMDITMDIQKGKMVAVVGESGAGKSTIIDIIMGFHQPTKGKVIIDKTNLEEFDVVSFRKRIGYVPQESVLFDTSVADNLLWSYDKASQRDIESACRLANADEFINSMPEKYNTVVGNRGVRLSGGQVQRVALARAILRKPELLILDEATSNLDTNSERLIQQAIENIARQTTVIVIAHRLSTIKNADYIYLLKNGQIAEQGAYADLAQKKGHFNRMIELQLLESAE